ncbi:NfeD family protein [Malikia spinosa]|uniref:NfeD family protein n=1 Tax=Malikia spinosa TaxID=86180 RepID=A0A7C9J3K8_9BURK|nr:NfeD family protein [Malikia spinosa]MYZ52775.1 NfeD family protein [Malikia spinosa]
MSDSTVWWLLTAAAVALELLNGSFYLLMLGIGLAAAALAAHLGAGLALQLTVAALVGGGAVLFWSQRMRQRSGPADSAANADLNLDIGQLVQVEHWAADGSASVRHRGAEWTAELDDAAAAANAINAAQPAPGRYRIVAVRGSHLILQAHSH